ncbi:WD40/YVTN/BNR-like repeat-containing protein [Spirillospora sp. NPDC048911]|uniref:WD40/YVTN/BNR-like repeat-containing protein n=1 Tax=Spirillospora sp. NPDC048911 TaxID=3364527 RepID=UPI00371B9A01
MTTPRTPDDEPGDDQTRADSFDQPSAPPPPQWLDEGQAAPGAHLLPEPPQLPPDPVEAEPPTVHDQTITDADVGDAMRTQVVPAKQPGGGEQAGTGEQAEPATRADAEATTFIAAPGTGQPQSPAAAPQPQGDAQADAQAGAQADSQATTFIAPGQAGTPAQGATPPAPASPPAGNPSLDMTMSDFSRHTAGPQQPQPPVTPPPPAPFPYAQQIPGQPQPPAPSAPEPFPYAQEIPGAQPPSAPVAPEPFPYAQEIPGAQPPPAPAAPEPFPYAQEIPGAQPPPAPAAPEPFPYAQEIPGVPSPNASAAPPPFPYAQEIPGAGQAGPAASPTPLAPPPQIDEPWRTPTGGKRGRGLKIGKKPLLIGVGGLAAVALVAAGGFVVLSGGEDDGGDGSLKLAKNVFPIDPAARTDGRQQELTDVSSVGSTVVAVGEEADPDQDRGVFLVSGDGGKTFKQASVGGLEGSDPASGDVPRQVAGSDRGWVAIGSRAGGGAVWTSRDGKDWERQPDAIGDVFGPGNRVKQVITSGGGFVAIGENSRKGDFSDSQPALWLSADGKRWEVLIGDKVAIPAPARKGKVTLIEAAASGNAILLGTSHIPDPKKPRAGFRRVWRSDDGGRTWAPAKVPAPKGSRGLSIGGGKPGLLVVREVQEGKKRPYGQAYTSTDGQSWTAAGKVESSGYRQVSQILATDSGYAALVVRGRDILISRTRDGRSWQDAGLLTNKSGQALQGAALSGEQAVLVGRTAGAGDNDPLLSVWDASGTRLPVDPAKVPGAERPDHNVAAVAAGEGRAVAVGSAGGDAALWSTQDGRSWTAGKGSGSALTRSGSQMLLDVTAGKSGWLAVGFDEATPRKPVVLTSADAATWQAVDGNAEFRPARDSLTTFAAASGPTGYVIVGDEGLSATTWFSADLKKWERGKGVGSNALAVLPNSNRWMRSVAGGSFGYVAVGGVRDPNAGNAPANRPAVWTSTDGKQWTLQQPQLPGGLPEGFLSHVAAKGNILVAAGTATTGTANTALAYVSTDGGKSWRETKLPAPDGATGIDVTALTETPGGFAATGVTGRQGATDVVSWTSADGTSWTPAKPGGEGLGGPGDQQITGLAALDGTLLGVGRTVTRSDEQPVLWSRPVS